MYVDKFICMNNEALNCYKLSHFFYDKKQVEVLSLYKKVVRLIKKMRSQQLHCLLCKYVYL